LLHSYKNTIKTTAFQFSCHSLHPSSHHNTLTTNRLCEMLKVTATKRKNKIGLMSNNDYYADENLRIIIISEI
ncbi:hypothetical protein, partial [Prevotella histicola]|uniref:hypothetical protein n=1 Tax=Prevotella histicola TaxID=470565 RepID=UPI00241BF84B